MAQRVLPHGIHTATLRLHPSAVNPATAHRAGPNGPPVGSRPRPVQTVDVAPVFPAEDPVPLSSSTFSVPNSQDSLAAFAMDEFTYYPMMSPYEAEVSLSNADIGIQNYRNQQRQYEIREGEVKEEQEKEDNGQQPEMVARRLPLLDHDLLSAEQAAAALIVAARRRNTIFIDRGFDVRSSANNSRDSSCYGGEAEVRVKMAGGGIAAGMSSGDEESARVTASRPGWI
ncbi:hypothetical protein VTI28DRAFT_5215 [Corynascus sepedonium]